jgi:hypothetical protein
MLPAFGEVTVCGLGPETYLQELIAWSIPIVSLVASILCFSVARVSRRAMVLGAGFLLAMLGEIGKQFVLGYLHSGGNVFLDDLIRERRDLVFLVASGTRLIGFCVVFLGIVLVYVDLRSRLHRRGEGDDYDPLSRSPARDEHRSW